MRALTISAHGGLDRIEYRDDVPTPELQHADEVRVRVAAGALNHLDLFVVGGLPNVTITPPWVLGADATGIVDAVGDAVTHVAVGDTVIVNPGSGCGDCEYCRDGEPPLCVRYAILGEHRQGTLAEYVVTPGHTVHAVPAIDPRGGAAAFGLATLTAWRMVVTRAAVREGDDVLIWGIGGGVAQQALQIARSRGARVWVTSGSDEKLARARELGAHETLNHHTQDVVREIRSRTGKRGVDVVVDDVGEATWQRVAGGARAARTARDVRCHVGADGADRRAPPVLEPVDDHGKHDGNRGRVRGHRRRSWPAGRLLPAVDSVYPLDRGRAAFERLASGEQFGKIVVAVES